MKTYNRALDYVALALEQHAKGRVATAAQLFVKAAASPDMKQAVKVIEASNAQAHSTKQAVQAKARAAAEAQTRAQIAAAVEAERKQLASILGDSLPTAEFAATEPECAEDKAIEKEVKEEKEVDATAVAFANALRAAVQK
jgi:hypothetical protein